jgi:hypothetical protein
VNVTMVSLKWGDALSILLPGALALFAIAPYFPLLEKEIGDFNQIGVAAGTVLLIAAILCGGVLEAWTRIVWEPLWLLPHCKPKVDPLRNLAGQKLEVFEMGVQSSYKWVTFYANFAWATLLLLISREQQGLPPRTSETLLLGGAVIILLRASHVQWTYYVEFVNRAFGLGESNNAAKPAPARNPHPPTRDREEV